MAQIIDLEHQRFLKAEKIRHVAYQLFPWRQLETLSVNFLEPMILFWSEQKKHILLELVYRLVFEVYVFGIIEAKRAKGHRRFLTGEHSWDDVYLHFYQEECNGIIQQVVNDFALFQWLDEWRSEALFILLEDLARIWFIEGVQIAEKNKRLIRL